MECSPGTAERHVDPASSDEQLDPYITMCSSKPPPPGERCAVCHQACLGAVQWSDDEVPVPTCGNTCYLRRWRLQGDTIGDDSDKGDPQSYAQRQRPLYRCSGSSVQPAHYSSDADGQSATGRIAATIDCGHHIPLERLPPPRLPESFAASRHSTGRNAASTLRQNSSGSAEQPVLSLDASSPVPVHSLNVNTGLSQLNSQSGDLVPCHRAKPAPPAFSSLPRHLQLQ